MTDFFSNLGSGIRFPDARIGGSTPLPTSLSGPAGINGDPDGRYNFNGNLLDGIAPYAGPDGGRMGSDRNYQQIPHRIQHIIPKIYLPKGQYLDNPDRVGVSHAVDQGDIAFVIVSERVQHMVMPGTQYNGPKMQMPSRNAFVNLPTVNYLLAGLQRLDDKQDNAKGMHRGAWAQLADDLQFNIKNPNRLAEILRLVSTRMLPYGICAGSENQGGKHETGLAPVQSAANHVTTMTVDGQNRDLVNYWRASNVSAGDVLIFRLEKVPTKAFTLNHYYKEMIYEDFGREQICYQLVPDVFRMSYDPSKTLDQKHLQPDLNHSNIKYNKQDPYDFRINGYWRIGQMFHHRNQHDLNCNNYSDDKVFLRGQLMQVTFAPMWIQMDERLSVTGNPARNQNAGLGDDRKRKAMEDERRQKNMKRATFATPRNGHSNSATLRTIAPPAPPPPQRYTAGLLGMRHALGLIQPAVQVAETNIQAYLATPFFKWDDTVEGGIYATAVVEMAAIRVQFNTFLAGQTTTHANLQRDFGPGGITPTPHYNDDELLDLSDRTRNGTQLYIVDQNILALEASLTNFEAENRPYWEETARRDNPATYDTAVWADRGNGHFYNSISDNEGTINTTITDPARTTTNKDMRIDLLQMAIVQKYNTKRTGPDWTATPEENNNALNRVYMILHADRLHHGNFPKAELIAMLERVAGELGTQMPPATEASHYLINLANHCKATIAGPTGPGVAPGPHVPNETTLTEVINLAGAFPASTSLLPALNATSNAGNPPPSKPKIVVRKAADAMEGGSAGSSKKKKSGGLFGKRLDDT